MTELSIVPKRRVRDPRQLLYHYPNLPAQRFAKLAQVFYHDQTLRTLENAGKGIGYLLIPSGCLHWKWKKNHSDRQVQVGYQTFYFARREEITQRTYEKYLVYVHEIQAPG